MNNFEILNPYSGEVLGAFPFTTQQDLERSLSEATSSVSSHNLATFERAQILENLAKLVLQNEDELSQAMSKEMGKPITDARLEVQRAANTAGAVAAELKCARGDLIDSDAYPPEKRRRAIVERVPLGVLLAVTPFNFPINLPMHKIAPAFAMGNAVLFKPNAQNFFTAELLTKLCKKAGMPEEMLQLICPTHETLASILGRDEIAAISLTGGRQAAEAIAASAGVKPLLFELGGNDPMIVCDDADLELAATTAVAQRFRLAGQRCNAPKRFFLHARIFSEFESLLIEKTKQLILGDPLKEETDVGPMVNAAAADQVMERIQHALDSCGTLLVGGVRNDNFISPAVLKNVPVDSKLVQDETFGPVAPLFQFDDYDDLAEQVNATTFGLQAGIFTQRLDRVKHLFEKLNVGAVVVNDGPGYREDHFPFGGSRQSGIGREGARYAMEEFSQQKTLIF